MYKEGPSKCQRHWPYKFFESYSPANAAENMNYMYYWQDDPILHARLDTEKNALFERHDYCTDVDSLGASSRFGLEKRTSVPSEGSDLGLL
jgi:hypothetical protein